MSDSLHGHSVSPVGVRIPCHRCGQPTILVAVQGGFVICTTCLGRIVAMGSGERA